MIVRFTYLTFSPDSAAEAKEVYTTEVAPVIREYKGNQDVMLLEPEKETEPYISCTFWLTKQDLMAFEASEEYKTVMHRIKMLAIKAEQQYYKVV